MTRTLRLGTRGSKLALAQSGQVASQLRAANPGLSVELSVIKTTGDRVQDRPLHDLGGKGLFTKEIELALLAGEIDVAVHSYKDVPVTMPLVDEAELVIAAVPPREDVTDAMVAGGRGLDQLPGGSVIGTGSLRRQSQLLDLRPDLRVEPIRGNIDTRLKLVGKLDGVILATAGLIRAGLFDSATMVRLPVEQFVPAAGQGALAIQCRRSDAEVIAAVAKLDDPHTRRCVDAERAVIAEMGADCRSPVGVYATVRDGRLIVLTAVGGAAGVVRHTR